MAKKKTDLDYSYTQNRELSWLKFNERVLEEAKDSTVPLLERLKFISIFTSNLDEFFMIRCGSLYDLTLVKKDHMDNKTGMKPQEQLDAICAKTKELYTRKDDIFNKLAEKLKDEGITHLEFDDFSKEEANYFNNYFFNYVLPVLSPQIIDIQHPFPHLTNKSLNLVILLEDSINHKKHHNKNAKYYEHGELFGIIPIPESLPDLLCSPTDSSRYILLKDLIYEYASEVFTNYKIKFKTIISVTRNADINLSSKELDDDEDYRKYMKKILKKRTRLAPIRLEVYKYFNEDLQSFLVEKLGIKHNQIFLSESPLDVSFIFDLADEIEKKDMDLFKRLSYDHFEPKFLPSLKNQEIIPQLDNREILLFYPYETMDAFLKLLKEAANDPDVLSIKITIYRVAKKSDVIKYLVMAIENGKDVTVLMELKARFDESNNIRFAEILEDAGGRVIYGFEKYKVHSKVCLITRRSKDNGIEYITQLGTGNYNEKTSKIYSDFCYITSKKAIGEDAMAFFNNIGISNLKGDYKQLLVAPYGLRQNLNKLIDAEIEKAQNGENANIVMKMNSLTDRNMIDKLQFASSEGVKIKLIIRGICCLIPGIPGVTDNIEVIGIVGRFLEHARVYCFGNGEDMSVYLSSADLMTRNMKKRVELAFPIHDKELRDRIVHILDIQLRDNVKGRMINSNGDYEKLMRGVELLDSQEYFMDENLKDVLIEEKSESFFDKVKSFFSN